MKQPSEPVGDDMDLPAGKSCADCAYFKRCVAFIGERHIHSQQYRCDWAPSRFRPAEARETEAER